MTRRLAALAAAPAFVLLAGCGAVEDAADSVASRAGNAAADEVKRQICAQIPEGALSAQDKAVLSGLVATAKASGVSAEITDPLEEIARSGDAVPAESVTELREACA